MKIIINNHEIETNPSQLPENLLFKGTVYTGTSITETVYGLSKEEVLSLAYKLKNINKDFNTVHLYSPEGKYIGVHFL